MLDRLKDRGEVCIGPKPLLRRKTKVTEALMTIQKSIESKRRSLSLKET